MSRPHSSNDVQQDQDQDQDQQGKSPWKEMVNYHHPQAPTPIRAITFALL